MPTATPAARPLPQAVIALDLGGTKLASCAFAADGRTFEKRSLPLERRHGDAVGQLIVEEVQRLRRAAARRRLAVRAVGICVPGIVRRRTGRVWAPNIAGWDDYPLLSQIRASRADSSIKVILESDRAASILGEAWLGAARGCRNAIFLAVGTGIGAGILTDGRVLRGARDSAGAVGWLALDRPFRADYAQCGCFESHASGEGIAKVASALVARAKSYRGPLRAGRLISAHDVFGAYDRGDPLAETVLAEATEFWGMASANLISLYNPEIIVFGGGVFGPAARFLADIAREARRWAQPIAVQDVKFVVSQLGPDAALYGAAYAAFRSARMPLP
jgi:glucokinase